MPSSHFIVSIALGLTCLAGSPNAFGQSPDETVYLFPGQKRVHLPACRRYKRKSDAEKQSAKAMTFAQAQSQNLPLCSRCPGSTTLGKGNPGEGGSGKNTPSTTNKPSSNKGLPESWSNPAPDTIRQFPFTPSPLSPLISFGSDGKLQYTPYTEKGDTLPDWSYCGYKRSEVPIPDVPVKITLNPPAGAVRPDSPMFYPKGPDSHAIIQEALNNVGSMPANADGSRGAVLLTKGTWYVYKSLTVPSGVVLRGEGNTEQGTVIIAKGSPGGRGEDAGGVAITVGKGSFSHSDEKRGVSRITDAYVPTGSMSLTVEDSSTFKPGQLVNVLKTTNQKWIDDLGMGQRLKHIRGGKEGAGKKPWTPERYQIWHIREISSIEGNKLTLDLPLPQSIDAQHGGGEVYLLDGSGLATHSGVESLMVKSDYTTKPSGKKKNRNFKNYWNGIQIQTAENSWVRDCTVKHVSFAAVIVKGISRYNTVRDCKALEPVGVNRGGHRYAFTVGGGTGHLFLNLYSEDGRHCFVGGKKTIGPFAFVNCTSVRGGQSEPHHRWGTGFLYDNVSSVDGSIAGINRGDSGSGHGWAAANTLIWNGNAKNIIVFDPETEGENNFAIGYSGPPIAEVDREGIRYSNTRGGYWGTPREGKFYGYVLMGNGYIESPDGPVEPRSLFTQQLIDRIGKEQAMAVLEQPSPGRVTQR